MVARKLQSRTDPNQRGMSPAQEDALRKQRVPEQNSSPAVRPGRFLKPLLALVAVLAVVAWLAGPALQSALTRRLSLRQPAPDGEGPRQWLLELQDPSSAVQALWQHGQVPHRYAAVRFTKNYPDRVTVTVAKPLLIEAAQDADLSVRELALAALAARQDPLVRPLAMAQLRDVDPEVRRLGVRYLARQADPALAPQFIALLKDPDPLVVGLSTLALRKITGQHFGPPMRDLVSPPTSPSLPPEQAARLATGVRAWQDWWAQQRENWLAAHPAPAPPPITRPARPFPVTADFALTDLKGAPARLSDFRGRVVWLNFWATWCTACASEMPLLNQLQAHYGKRLVVLGIALDHPASPAASTATRARLQRTVRQRGIRYRVLWDSDNAVGSRFNGGELPTHVLIAPDGRVHRRFIGPRSLATFRQMVEELLEPNPAVARPSPPPSAQNHAGQETATLPQSPR